jgi:hypothetical protein
MSTSDFIKQSDVIRVTNYHKKYIPFYPKNDENLINNDREEKSYKKSKKSEYCFEKIIMRNGE